MSFQFEAARLLRRSKVSFLVLAFVAVAAWPGVSMAGGASDHARAVAGSETKAPAFDMRHVERVRIRVWGNADLSGEYNLDHQASLSFPGLGRIEVGSMTPAELERMLGQRLGALTRSDVTVSVDVEQFRPFYIMGHVAEPGAIAWRPGLKVLQALTLARGVARSSESVDAAAGQDRVVAHRQSQTRLTFALAQLARYKAEREGGEVVNTNKRIATLISSLPKSSRTALTDLVRRQNDMLTEQRDVMQTQIIGLQREREASQRELEAAETQEKAVLMQLELTRDLMADIDGLWKKKLISRTRYLDQRSALLTSEVRYAEAHSMVERARARLSSIDQQIVMIPQQRRVTLNERIDELEREVAQLEHVSVTRDDPQNVLNLAYHITRESGLGVETIAASIFTEILPGDVLIVSEPKGVGAVTTLSGEPYDDLTDGKAAGADHASNSTVDGPRSTAQHTVSARDMRGAY